MPGTRRPVGATGAHTVTISFAGFNRAWATWIGDRLERRGVTVVQQRWDPPVEVPLEESLRDLTLSRGRVLVILSDWYFQLGPRSHDEWNRALREVVAPDPDRFAAVCVTTSALPGATSALGAADLTNVGGDEAERRLLARLGLPTDPLPEPVGSRQGPRYPADVPEVWGGVPRRNTRFTGREELLSKAYQALQDAGPGAGVVTLHGMSGVGKTQLAAEYVYRFGSEYDVVWWVPADRRALYRQKLAELAPELGLSTGAEYGERLRAVRDALRRGEPHSHWLLVLDGADEPEHIWDLVPTGPGHVLITSRNPEWSEHNSNLVEVPVYERDESVAFIRRRAPRLTPNDADQLAEALEDLPLLLDQTAGWLNDSDMSVEEYIELLEGGIDQDVVKVSADFPLAFQTAWSILLNKLKETVPESVDLLRLCSFFAPGSIPVRLLREMPPGELPEQLSGLMNDPLLWNKAIAQLRQYSVVRLESHETVGEEASSGESLYMHRMVHQIVGKDMPERDREEFIGVVRRALAAADPGRPTDTRLWPAYAEITPHLKWADVLTSTDPAVHTLVLNCLRYMYLSGEYRAGIKLGERALKAWRRLLGEDHPGSGTSATTTRTCCGPSATTPVRKPSNAPPSTTCGPNGAHRTWSTSVPPAASPPTCGASAATTRHWRCRPGSSRPTANSWATRTRARSARRTTWRCRSGCSAGTRSPWSCTGGRWRPGGRCCASATAGRSTPRSTTPPTCVSSASTPTPSRSRTRASGCTGWSWDPTTRRPCAPSTISRSASTARANAPGPRPCSPAFSNAASGCSARATR